MRLLSNMLEISFFKKQTKLANLSTGKWPFWKISFHSWAKNMFRKPLIFPISERQYIWKPAMIVSKSISNFVISDPDCDLDRSNDKY